MSLYWERHPDGPFVTLITVAATYLHPENYDLESLQKLARREDLPRMRVFKAELRQALRDPGQLPRGELSRSVQYDDGSPEAFLRSLWHDLYGGEPALPPEPGRRGTAGPAGDSTGGGPGSAGGE